MATALRAVDQLLKKVLAHGMLMILPKGTPMLEAKATKNWTRLDNVFCSANVEDLWWFVTLTHTSGGWGQTTSQS